MKLGLIIFVIVATHLMYVKSIDPLDRQFLIQFSNSSVENGHSAIGLVCNCDITNSTVDPCNGNCIPCKSCAACFTCDTNGKLTSSVM